MPDGDVPLLPLNDAQRSLVDKVLKARTGRKNNALNVAIAVKARGQITTKESFYLAIVAWRYRHQYELTKEEHGYIKDKFAAMQIKEVA